MLPNSVGIYPHTYSNTAQNWAVLTRAAYQSHCDDVQTLTTLLYSPLFTVNGSKTKIEARNLIT